MNSIKPVGRSASVIKYDLLTAVGVFALSRGKHEQRLILRFVTLIVARYNWNRDHLSIGQDEIAKLWSVDTRTVKRDMAKLRGMGWLVLKQQGARGRVARYGLDLDAIRRATEPDWKRVGPDFEQRMTREGQGTSTNVVPMRPSAATEPPEVDGTEWSLAQTILYQEDPSVATAWFTALKRDGLSGGRLVLRAPSRFHADYVSTHFTTRLLSACRTVSSDIDDVVVLA